MKEKVERGPLFDMAITRHSYTSTFRDYDVIVSVVLPAQAAGTGKEKWCRYRLSHCVLAETTTALSAEVWQVSWPDTSLNFTTWEANNSEGYAWGVCHIVAYPGPRYVTDSQAAKAWSEQLKRTMHEAITETNVQNLRLIFHDLTITEIPPES